MTWTSNQVSDFLEIAIILFQVGGVLALVIHRLAPASRWANRGRAGAILAVVGLGVAGAVCGRHDSEFALFAGATMTFLLIGMTIESEPLDTTVASRTLTSPEPHLAG